jgi:single-strand DNA-binding protein
MSAPITLTGRLGAEPELRFSSNGTAIVRLSIVTSRRSKNEQTGEWSDADVTWWDATGFRQLAENAASSLAKGMPVIAVGRVVQENWEDKQTGQKRSKLALKLDAIGPDLNRTVAKVEKANTQQQSGSQQRPAQQDPWARNGASAGGGDWGQQGGQPASSGWGAPPQQQGGHSEEPPF